MKTCFIYCKHFQSLSFNWAFANEIHVFQSDIDNSAITATETPSGSTETPCGKR